MTNRNKWRDWFYNFLLIQIIVPYKFRFGWAENDSGLYNSQIQFPY